MLTGDTVNPLTQQLVFALALPTYFFSRGPMFTSYLIRINPSTRSLKPRPSTVKHGLQETKIARIQYVHSSVFDFIYVYIIWEYLQRICSVIYKFYPQTSKAPQLILLLSFYFKLLDPLAQSFPMIVYLPKAMTQYHSGVYAVRDHRRKNIVRLPNFHKNVKKFDY